MKKHFAPPFTWTLFSANADDGRLVALDRLARTLHALNFIAGADDGGLLFLNVHGRLLAAVADDHGAAFRKVVDALGLPPERIVIETPLSASAQPDLLSFVLRNYRQNGFQVAVNVRSPEEWQTLAPTAPAQFVKIDGSALLAEEGGLARLRALVGLVAGAARVVMTRLERPLAGELVQSVFVQGFTYGPPALGVARGA